jgi:hypothetical protein
MLTSLFNIFIDGLVIQVILRILERGLTLVSDNERQWQLNQMLYAGDIAKAADKGNKLQRICSEFG